MAKRKLPAGTWIERSLMESKAFLSLRGFAPQLLILILAKRQFQRVGRKGKEERICINGDSITFTYKEAKAKYGLSVPKVFRAVDELLAKGFLSIRHHGGAYKQDKTLYALSNRWTTWTPGSVFERRPRDPVKRGYCEPRVKS
jgi:hypothetical protein